MVKDIYEEALAGTRVPRQRKDALLQLLRWWKVGGAVLTWNQVAVCSAQAVMPVNDFGNDFGNDSVVTPVNYCVNDSVNVLGNAGNDPVRAAHDLMIALKMAVTVVNDSHASLVRVEEW